MSRFNEDDVALAREYAALLEKIEELGGTATFDEDDVALAREHVAALERIEELNVTCG